MNSCFRDDITVHYCKKIAKIWQDKILFQDSSVGRLKRPYGLWLFIRSILIMNLLFSHRIGSAFINTLLILTMVTCSGVTMQLMHMSHSLHPLICKMSHIAKACRCVVNETSEMLALCKRCLRACALVSALILFLFFFFADDSVFCFSASVCTRMGVRVCVCVSYLPIPLPY